MDAGNHPRIAAAQIDDKVLHEFVTIGSCQEIGQRLIEHYGSVVTSVEFSIPVINDTDHVTLARLVTHLQATRNPQADHAFDVTTP